MFQFFKKGPLEDPKWREIKAANAALSDDGDSMDGLLGHGINGNKSKWSPRHYTARTILCILLGLNLLWTFTNLTTLWLQHPFQLNHNYRKISTPSLIFDHVDLGPITKRMNGSIHNDGSIYRKAPSPEVDKAWDRLAMKGYEVINATAAQLRDAGEDPEKVARWGPDVDSYPVEIEVGHKLHCLNMVRMAIWGHQYFGENDIRADDEALARGDYKDDEEDLFRLPDHMPTLKGRRRMRRAHIMHCIDMLRQDLMCNADVGIIPIIWVQGKGIGRSELEYLDNFNTLKQCRDYETLLDWVHDNSAHGEGKAYESLRYFPGAHVFKTNDSYLP